jgi:homoserine dehydrogenase
MRKQLTIGLFGFGCVGQGLYDVLRHTRGLQAEIKRICVKHPDKKRSLPAEYFTYEAGELLRDSDINVIVELIDDADAAYYIVKEALLNGKAVVSANKKMIAAHLPELLEIQRETGVPFLYEAAACASIPVIRNLEEYYDNDLLTSIQGIINGSTNYILTAMQEGTLSYEEALTKAQTLGFAESNPFLDVSGQDARNKLVLLAAHAFGTIVSPEDIFFYGIDKISTADIAYAREKGYTIRLLAQAIKQGEQLQLWVLPQFVEKSHPLAAVKDEYNAVLVEGVFSDKQFFSGKGAGSHPTASAVLSDISALSYGYRYEYKKTLQEGRPYHQVPEKLRLYVRFPSHLDSAELPFDHVDEIYRSLGLCYISGIADVPELATQGWLENKDVFIAELPQAVPPELFSDKEVITENFEWVNPLP